VELAWGRGVGSSNLFLRSHLFRKRLILPESAVEEVGEFGLPASRLHRMGISFPALRMFTAVNTGGHLG